MSIGDRLRRLARQGSASPAREVGAAATATASDAHPAPAPGSGSGWLFAPAPPLAAPPAAARAATAAPDARPPAERPGLLRRITAFPLDHLHGARRLAEVAALDPVTLARLGDAAAPAEGPAAGARRSDGTPLFFDTETTSLASGAGVLVFLVGTARVEGDRFVVEQLYLEDPGAEPEMLRAAGERIAAAPLLVSFSGRGFDERRLEDRYRFRGMAPPFRPGAHADLCPLARSLWRARLPSCALGVLERARLGVRRHGDLPGAACPEAYFRSLRGDEAAREAILRHNLWDLLSTATLAAEALARAASTAEPSEALGLALHHLRRGRAEEALGLLLRAEALEARGPALTGEERARLLLEAAALLRRAGREEEALRRWRALASARPPSLDALLALAKHAEHGARDLDLARRAAARALALVRSGEAPLTPARRRALEADLTQRVIRVEAKARRRAGAGGDAALWG